MAPPSIAVDASTLGLLAPDDLRVAQLNFGLAQPNRFSKDNNIEEHLDTLHRWILDMSKRAHIIVLNELHQVHHVSLDMRRLEHPLRLLCVGVPCGDALVWCLILIMP